MVTYRVEFRRSTLGGLTLTRNVEAKGYRSAFRTVYQNNKPAFGGQFGLALWCRVTNLSTGKAHNYFVKLSKRGRILKIE